MVSCPTCSSCPGRFQATPRKAPHPIAYKELKLSNASNEVNLDMDSHITALQMKLNLSQIHDSCFMERSGDGGGR